ncbi:MAG: hypothetical protein OEW69_08455 [Nitrospirota bacterium]|nr:hypothetical protein [Nitrospirota bacterium]
MKWKFWGKGKDGEQRLTNLARLESEGVLKTLTTDTLQTRIHELHDDLTEALQEFRKASTSQILPTDLVLLMNEKQRAKYVGNRVQALESKREALDKIILALSDQAWPWNRAGDRDNSDVGEKVADFLILYEEYKELPGYYDPLFTLALQIIQLSYKAADVTQEIPIVIFTPVSGKKLDLRDMQNV